MSNLGLVIEDTRQRQWLENQLVKASHYVLLSCDVAHLESVYNSLEEKPEVWLVLLPDSLVEEALDYISRVSTAPTLVLDDWPEERDRLVHWQRQMMQKLDSALLPTLNPSTALAPEQVWLLGASLGGPEAVVEFLRALPADIPIAFVYVQHIEEAFDQALVSNLNRNTPFEAQLFTGELRLGVGRILIVAPEKRPRFLPFGRVISSSRAWRGGYRPCIDDVGSDLAQHYRERLGMIVFSGTCNDGEQAARDVARFGGQVWSQSAASCLSDTMPEAVNRTGLSRVSGTPQQLASTLAGQWRKTG